MSIWNNAAIVRLNPRIGAVLDCLIGLRSMPPKRRLALIHPKISLQSTSEWPNEVSMDLLQLLSAYRSDFQHRHLYTPEFLSSIICWSAVLSPLCRKNPNAFP